MVIRLHKNARTTPAIRRELQRSTLPTGELAERYGLSRQTVSKWRGRSSTEDASHRPHRLHTRLTPVQEAVVVELRKTLLLPLDDLLAVTHELSAPPSRVRDWIAVCAVMASPTSRPSSRRRWRPTRARSRPSKTISRALSMST
jgi:hypothetical protein